MKKRIFALALALCMMLSVMPTSFAGNGFLTLDNGEQAPSVPSGILTDDSKAAPQSGVLTGASKYYRDGILYNTGSQSGAPYSLPSGTLNAPTGVLTLDENVNSTTTLSGSGISAGARSSALVTDDKNGLELSKEVNKVGDNYKITLEAYVTGEKITSSVKTAGPMDIILVLDTSGQMATATEYSACTEKKLNTLKEYSLSGELYYEENGQYYLVMAKEESTLLGTRYTLFSNGKELDQWFAWNRNPTTGKTYYQITATDSGVARLSAMKEAAFSFINAIAPEDVITNERRVALVEYNSDATVLTGGRANDGALWRVDTNKQKLIDKINGLSVKLDTEANCQQGLNAAKQIFQSGNNTVEETRPRVVILLSAGVFGSSGSLSKPADAIVAMDSIWLSSILKMPRGYDTFRTDREQGGTYNPNGNNNCESYTIQLNGYTYGIDFGSRYYMDAAKTKEDFQTAYGSDYQGCGATIYCIGLDMPESTSYYGDIGNRINEVMYRVSSHRPDGTHVDRTHRYNEWEDTDWSGHYTDSRTRNHTQGYFLTADNDNDLKEIFKSISSDITTGGADNTTLTSATVVQDAISKYFEIPAGSNATAHTETYTGEANGNKTWSRNNDDWTLTPVKNSDGTTTVQATGFDFAENWVGTDNGAARGNKLVIEITIKSKAGFLGGNNVPTNDDANAGVYLNSDLVENFPNGGASTNVPVADVTVDVTDKNIYLSQTLDESGLLAGATVKVGSVGLDMTNTTTYGLEAWQYAYVTISTNVATNTGAKWTDDEVPFTLTCTVETKDKKVVKSAHDTANVNVFKPVVTFQDSTIYLGTTPTYSNNYVDVVWKHGDTEASESMGAAPELTYSYSWLETAAPTDCTDVNVGVAIDQNDVTSHVTFTDTRTDENEFTVHVVKPVITSADITIYLSNTVDLNGQMTEAGNWVCGHTGSEQKTLPANNGETRLAPTIDYAFKVGDTPVSTPAAYRPLGCTEIKATATVNDKNAPISTDATGKDYSTFQIHVLKPAFTVTCTDLWADYGTNVTLANHLNTTVTGWSDSTAEHTGIPTVTGSAPTVFTYTYKVKDGGQNVVETHTVTENDADFTVELASFKIGALDCGTRWSKVTVNKVDGADSDHNFTIHTNKFDLTIHKTWDGADVYKQDAIFTVSGGLGKFQVVLPAGQESITVKNLLCGQDYTVTEDSNWTWRWSDDGTKTVTTHKHGVTTDMPTSHIASEGATAETSVGNSVSFINTLVKQLWFDFCKLVQNIFGVGKGE